MINIQNLSAIGSIDIHVQLNAVSGTRELVLGALKIGQITEAEYTKNPDYYNQLQSQGLIAMTSSGNLNDVEDEPANHQKGSAVSGL